MILKVLKLRKTMRCASYCTAESYDIHALRHFFDEKGAQVKMHDEVLHVFYPNDNGQSDIFFFPYGALIAWNMGEGEERELIAALKPFEVNSLPKSVEDTFRYAIGADTEVNEEEDLMIFGEDDPLIKLSFSHGLSQSAKLATFEESIVQTIQQTRHLPMELARTGRISLSRKKLSQQLGELFEERNSMNLHSDIMDIPEFFWRRPKYEPYYLMAAKYVDIQTRLEIVNKKLDVIHDLYDVLSQQLNHLQTARMELVIILLIAIEVLLVVAKDILKLF